MKDNKEIGWIDANRHPLADVSGDDCVILAGYEDQRLFAIKTKGGWEYHAGHMDETGTLIAAGDDVGRNAFDVDFYINISEPNAEPPPPIFHKQAILDNKEGVLLDQIICRSSK